MVCVGQGEQAITYTTEKDYYISSIWSRSRSKEVIPATHPPVENNENELEPKVQLQEFKDP